MLLSVVNRDRLCIMRMLSTYESYDNLQSERSSVCIADIFTLTVLASNSLLVTRPLKLHAAQTFATDQVIQDDKNKCFEEKV